jgi:thiol-disulfide isomerase/thioredoxin
MKRFLSFEVSICILGVAAIVGVAALDPKGPAISTASAAESRVGLPDEGPLPDLGGATNWRNTAPLHRKSLRGKVVLVNFWTYSCINSLRELPYMKGWAAKYKDAGLVVIGVHTPEFSFETERANVDAALADLQIAYPVAIDSNRIIWQSFNNEYWPADYIVDGKGRIRYHHFGEGEYGEAERVIQQLLRENGAVGLDESPAPIPAQGIEVPPSTNVRSPETYVGYRQAERFASPERLAQDSRRTYVPPSAPSLNQWGFGGSWNVGAESAVLQASPGSVVFRFHARDLHIVLGPTRTGKPVRFKVTLDGAAPGENSGVDSRPDGSGEVREPRLYQLIRQKGQILDRTFEIKFLDSGVQAFSFTFG